MTKWDKKLFIAVLLGMSFLMQGKYVASLELQPLQLTAQALKQNLGLDACSVAKLNYAAKAELYSRTPVYCRQELQAKDCLTYLKTLEELNEAKEKVCAACARVPAGFECPPTCNFDGVCDPNEDDTSCHSDCHCGNATCDEGENQANCPQDCGSV